MRILPYLAVALICGAFLLAGARIYYEAKSEKICLAAGFSGYRVDVSFQTYCTRRVNQTDEVVYMGRLK